MRPVSRARMLPLGRPGLRDRVALGFGLLGLLLSAVLAVAASFVVTAYVNHQSEAAAIAQTDDNAALLRTKVVTLEKDPGTIMAQLQFPSGVGAVLLFRGRRYPSPSTVDVHLPGDLVRQVRAGHRAERRLRLDGDEHLVVGVPFRDRAGDAFLEVISLRDLRTTLRTLWLILLVSAAATSVLGVVIGRVASRRLIRPLEDVTAAAAAIAHGDLSARLSPSREPDLAELARSFNRTAERLQDRVRADARFAGDIGHELRTPLTTMLNSLALLQNRRGELPAELGEPLGLLEEDLMRFRKLVLDLLEISRADGGPDGAVESVAVADLVRRAADGAAGRPVTRVAPAAEGRRLQTDKRRLERVVTNLVENAETHGGGCREVLVTASDGGVRIMVDDRGPGVPVELRERIFDRFVRFDRSGRTGTGLGLAIVARHVARLGGDVGVDDAPGGGARFVVELTPRWRGEH